MTTLQNLYADANVSADGYTMTSRSRNVRNQVEKVVGTSFITIAATDTSNSVYRMFKNLDPNLVLQNIYIGCSAMTALVISVGLYRPNLSLIQAPASGGLAVFLATTSIAAGAASMNPKTAFDGMATYWAVAGKFGIEDQRLFEIAGDTLAPDPTTGVARPGGYDLCITATTAATAGGTLKMFIEGYQG